MKYSILLPYHKRPALADTFESFVKFYGDRQDYEVIIVESIRTFEDAEEHTALINIVDTYKTKVAIKLFKNTDTGFSCAPAYNMAFEQSEGDFVILTNPESPHMVNILKGFDELFDQNENNYIICACLAIRANKSVDTWYQHSIQRNTLLHFCSALSRRNWLKIGGFCDQYRFGIAYEDNDFLERIKVLGIPIVTRDDLLVHHLEHSRSYYNHELGEINRKLFMYTWYNKDREGRDK